MTTTTNAPVACTDEDLSEMIALIDNEMRQGTGQSVLTDYPLVYADRNLCNAFVMKVDNTIASVVPFIPRKVSIDGCDFTIGIISPTATHPQHRKRGYASRCLDCCIGAMEKNDIVLSVLWTKVETFPFYERSGYQGVRSQGWIYRCKREDAALFADHGDDVVDFDPADEGSLRDIESMHEKEITGIVRSHDDYRALFSLPRMKMLLARRDGVSKAYLLVSSAVNKPGLIEGGGDSASLETLLHHALKNLGDGDEICVYANLTSSVLGDVIHSKMSERREAMAAGPMMIRINDVRGFLGKISPWLEKQNAGAVKQFSIEVTDTGDVVSFIFSENGLVFGSEKLDCHYEMTRLELTSIVFGSHPERKVDVPEAMTSLFPFYFPIWLLDHS